MYLIKKHTKGLDEDEYKIEFGNEKFDLIYHKNPIPFSLSLSIYWIDLANKSDRVMTRWKGYFLQTMLIYQFCHWNT